MASVERGLEQREADALGATGAAVSAAATTATTAVASGGRRAFLLIFDALEVRDFRLLWISMIVSNAGSWMQMIGQGWLVYELTGSPFWLGMVSFARAVPTLAFSLFGGVVADRVDRRHLLMFTQTCAGLLALILGVLTSAGVVTVWQIMAIAFVSATVMAFDSPTRQAIVPDLVGKDRLMNAVGLNSAAWNAAAVIGPSLAGVAIGVIGVAGCFYLNALSYAPVVWAVWAMSVRGSGRRPRGSMWQNLVEGLSFIRRHRVIFALFLIAAVPSFFGRPYSSLMPVFAQAILHGGPETYGILMSATGAGALVGALATAALGAFRRKGLILLGATAAFGLTLILFALSHWIWLSLVVLVLVGGCGTMYMGATNTLLQTSVTADFRGRIMSVYTLVGMGLMPLGGMLGGSAAELSNVSVVVAAGGALVAAAAIAVGFTVPGLRNME
ncbi:MAG TPA: MFS transporter [Thermomicrobiales bacterium]|nr:MFS transporter [Thermomicrobiales bacterium]